MVRNDKVEKPSAYLELGDVDIAELNCMVERLSEKVWSQEDKRKENAYPVLGSTKHIVFRFIKDNSDPHDFYSNPIWRIWKHLLVPILDRITERYAHQQVEYPKVMLARLPAGGSIADHSDGNGSHPFTHKVHVPLITNPSVLFNVNGQIKHLQAGRAYEVNNLARHSVQNAGKNDRIHLIFEHFDIGSRPVTTEPLS